MNEIAEYQRIFLTRLDTLDHILDVGRAHIRDLDSALHSRLAPDMFPLGTQVAFACNQARSFHEWGTGNTLGELAPDVGSVALAREHIRIAIKLVSDTAPSDARLDAIHVFRIGKDLVCELTGRQYVNDFLLPNLYFHIVAAYAILRTLGVPIGKADYMNFLAPHVVPVREWESRSTL